LKLEIDDLERRAIERSLAEQRSRLIEKVEDTTLTPARRRASLRELSVIASVLRNLRSPSRRAQPTQSGKTYPTIGPSTRPAPTNPEKKPTDAEAY
jgi:hypothetical protein